MAPTCAIVSLSLFVILRTAFAQTTSTELQIWCTSLGKNATYIKQSCYTVTLASQTYVQNLVSGCVTKPNGRLAMLTSSVVIAAVTKNVTKQFDSERFQIGLRQKNAASNGVADNFYWTGANMNTYGLNTDLKWNTGASEPNDWPGPPTNFEDGQEDCSDIGGSNALIYDSSCTNIAKRALCEYTEPALYYTPMFVGNSVVSSSAALISGQSDFKVIHVNHCAILCRVYGSCQAFVFKSNAITCTLLFRDDLSVSELIAEADATIYGF